jgi:hypothetical protein
MSNDIVAMVIFFSVIGVLFWLSNKDKKVKTKQMNKKELDEKYSELSKMKVSELKNLVRESGTSEKIPTKKKDLIEVAIKTLEK